MANPFVQLELNTTEVDKAKEFYSQLFAWRLERMAMGLSRLATAPEVDY